MTHAAAGRPTERGAPRGGEHPGLLNRIDAFQQRHAWVAFPYAVFRKFCDDQAGNLAALLAYYAFLSIFPLLLAATTVLGYVLAGDPPLQRELSSTVLGQFPIIGQQDPAHPLTGNAFGLVVGLVLAVWSGLGVAGMAQQAFNTVYGVPRVRWPGLPQRLLRSLELVTVGGLGLVMTTLLQGALSGADRYGPRLGPLAAVLGALVGIGLNAVLFTYLFRRLTVRELGWRDVIVGASVAAVAWLALQNAGTWLVNHKIAGARNAYGTFAVVIGLLFWFWVLSQITLYCAELNTVLTQRLWPRSLESLVTARARTEADRDAYEAYPQLERQVHNVDIEARVSGIHQDVRQDIHQDTDQPPSG